MIYIKIIMLENNGFLDAESDDFMDDDPNMNIKLDLLGRAKTVKFFGVVDIFFSLYYAVFFSWPCIFLALLSGSGYYGARHFKRSYIMAYIICIIIYTIIKIYLLSISNTPSMIFFSIISLLSEIYLLYIVGTFYYKLKEVSGLVLSALKEGWTPRIISFVYY
jgi:hypothetical protein